MAALPIAATITTSVTGAQPLQFHGWIGYIPDIAEIVDAQHRPGQDGTVAQGIGKVHDPLECTAHRFFRLKADAIAFAASIRALQQPTPSKFVDPWARSLRIRIHRASAIVVRVAGPVDGSQATLYQVPCSFTIERFPDAAA